MSSTFRFYMIMIAFSVLLPLSVAFAQVEAPTPQRFEASVRAADAAHLVAGKTTISLWGLKTIDSAPAGLLAKARNALDGVVGDAKVRCSLRERSGSFVSAQCENADGLDLGLYMLQNGYAVVDRAVIFGSSFEAAYIDAENQAQQSGLGIWHEDVAHEDNGFESGSFLIYAMSALAGFVLLVLSLAVFYILRGFKNVADAQQQNTDMIERERALKDKERAIFATMLDSEIKANKSKIEAYLAVYDEMLKDMRDPDKTPKYKQMGDIVQAQPSLDRGVFDKNTDKLDILGDRLSSQVIHFYARIKNKPDYIDLEPDMDAQEALEIVEKAHSNAVRLDTISDQLIDLFAQGGHSSDEV